MFARAIAWAATAASIGCLGGCPGSTPAPAPPRPSGDDVAVRTRVARAEARRGGGLAELVELARRGDKPERLLALRGLGRIGGPRALDAAVAALADPDPDVVAAAAGAIGLAGSLDELDPATTAAVTTALVDAMPRAGAGAPLVAEALGRAGDAGAQPILRAGLDAAPAIAIASATALGRHGRRKIALSDDARDALVRAMVHHAAPGVRASAAWALAREQLPPAPDVAGDTRWIELARQLAIRITDSEAEVRTQAIAALARRKLVRAAQPEIVQALRDIDWRVAVEAMRALTGDGADAAGRLAAAVALGERFGWLEAGDPHEAQVVIEGLRGFVARTADDGMSQVATDTRLALSSVAERAAGSKLPALTRGWIECLAEVVRTRRAVPPDYAKVEQCGHGGLPDHLRLPLVVELITAKAGAVAIRRAALARLLAHADVRVRAAAMAALAALWPDGNDADHRAAVATLIAGIGAADPILAGASIEAAPALYDAIKDGDRSGLDAAIVARARSERDVEIATALFELIGKRAIAAGADACRDGLAGHPARAKAAAGCLTALGVAPPGPPAAPAAPPATEPPVDLTAVIGKRVRWNLTTSRGELSIELRPDVAPWAVATIVELTRKGYYDNLEFHRVVPDFVVQGGDPTQSGWGGPGFAIPAEPATSADGPGFVQGGVGIADAGRDSGGSQWFIMHSRAAHLDGRYTWIGSLEAGPKSADALLIGDRVSKATVEVGPRTIATLQK